MLPGQNTCPFCHCKAVSRNCTTKLGLANKATPNNRDANCNKLNVMLGMNCPHRVPACSCKTAFL